MELSVPHNLQNKSKYLFERSYIKEINDIFDTSINFTRAICIQGDPGVGKTSMAEFFAHENARKYDLVRWFNAETDLYNQFKQFAEIVNYKEIFSSSRDFSTSIFNFLISKKIKKVLLIFDNVVDAKELNEFLPLEYREVCFHIIITTTIANISDNNIIKKEIKIAGNYTEIEAITHIGRVLSDKSHPESNNIEMSKKLAIHASYHPLLLDIMLAYIDNALINKFILEGEFEIFFDSTNMIGKNKTTITWAYQKLVEKMSVMEYGDQIINVLSYCAFLQPDYIQIDLIISMLKHNNSIIDEKAEIGYRFAISKYANQGLLIKKVDECAIKIHRISQQAIIDVNKSKKITLIKNLLSYFTTHVNLVNKNKKRSVNDNVLKLIPHIKNFLGLNLKNIVLDVIYMLLELMAKTAELLIAIGDYSYVISLISIRDKFTAQLSSFRSIFRDVTPDKSYSVFIACVGDACYFIGQYEDAIKYFEIIKNQKKDELIEKVFYKNKINEANHKSGHRENIIEKYNKLLVKISMFEHENSTKLSVIEINKIILQKLSLYRNMGDYYNDTKDFEGAKSCHQKAIKILEDDKNKLEDFFDIEPELAESYNSYANAFVHVGKYESAEEYYKKTLDLRIKYYSTEKHFQVVRALTNYGYAFYCQEKLLEAKKTYEDCLNLSVSVCGKNHYKNIFILINYAFILLKFNQFEEANIQIKKAHKLGVYVYGESLVKKVEHYSNNSIVWLKEDFFKKNNHEIESQLVYCMAETMKCIYGENHMVYAEFLYYLALIAKYSNEESNALSFCQASKYICDAKIAEKKFNEDNDNYVLLLKLHEQLTSNSTVTISLLACNPFLQQVSHVVLLNKELLHRAKLSIIVNESSSVERSYKEIFELAEYYEKQSKVTDECNKAIILCCYALLFELIKHLAVKHFTHICVENIVKKLQCLLQDICLPPGESFLHLAVELGCRSLIYYLREDDNYKKYSLDINAKLNNKTPLQLALELRPINLGIIKGLLSYPEMEVGQELIFVIVQCKDLKNQEKIINLLKLKQSKTILSPEFQFFPNVKNKGLVLQSRQQTSAIIYSNLPKTENQQVHTPVLSQISLIFKEKSMAEEKIGSQINNDNPLSLAVVEFNRNVIELTHKLEDIVKEIIANPEKYKLNTQGLCYAIIEAKAKGVLESTLAADIKKKSTKALSPFANERDIIFGFSSQHWCAVFNYGEANANLLARGIGLAVNDSDKRQLIPTHLAALVGSQAFLGKHFENKPEFSEIEITFESSDKQTHIFALNELHLALMGKQVEMVRDIFAKFANMHARINSDIKTIGNLLHLIVYIAHGEENAEASQSVRAVHLLQLILQQYDKNEIKKLLTESKNNHETCTPLVLAARYGQVGLVHALITYLKTHVEQSNGLRQVEAAFYAAAKYGQNDVVEMLIHYYEFKPSNEHNDYESTMDTLKEEKVDGRYSMILNLIRTAPNIHKRYNKSNPQEQPYENLVLSGGGGKGFALPYALKALRKHCQQRSQSAPHNMREAALGFENIVRVIGTSAGAIFGLAVALGYTPEEIESKLNYDFSEFLETDQLKEVIKQLNLTNPNNQAIFNDILRELELSIKHLIESCSEIIKSSWWKTRLAFEAAKQLFWHNEINPAIQKIKNLNNKFKGFSTGEVAYKFIAKLLTDKGLSANLTFSELANLVKTDNKKYKHLHVVVTNLSQSKFEVLSSENPLYKNYIILDAVRASMSYPIVFAPHHLQIKENNQIKELQDEYVDGGVLRNCATDEFDFKMYTNTDVSGDPDYPELNKKTIALRFKVEEAQQRASVQPSDLLSRVKQFVSIYMQAESLISEYMDRDYHRSIAIDTGHITTFTFKKLDEAEKQFLQKQADAAVAGYFSGNTDNSIANNISYAAARTGSPIYHSLQQPGTNNQLSHGRQPTADF